MHPPRLAPQADHGDSKEIRSCRRIVIDTCPGRRHEDITKPHSKRTPLITEEPLPW